MTNEFSDRVTKTSLLDEKDCKMIHPNVCTLLPNRTAGGVVMITCFLLRKILIFILMLYLCCKLKLLVRINESTSNNVYSSTEVSQDLAGQTSSPSVGDTKDYEILMSHICVSLFPGTCLATWLVLVYFSFTAQQIRKLGY